MTATSPSQVPLAGSTTVKSPTFDGSINWFTIGNVAFTRHLVHSGQDQFEDQDLAVMGQTLAFVAKGLAGQGVGVRFGVERPLGSDDPQGLVIAQTAGLSPIGAAVVMRSKIPMESGLTPSATGRPASPDGDRAGWISLVTAITGLEPVNDMAGIPAEPGDRGAVVDHPNGDGLAGFCWARRIASGPGSPGTAEVIEMGTDPSLDPAEAADVEQAAMAALAAMLEADGVRTLAVCVDGRLPGLDERLAAMGFVARRLRHTYAPVPPA